METLLPRGARPQARTINTMSPGTSDCALVVAAGQLRATSDPATNLRAATGVIREAADRGARLVVLPEATLAWFGTPLRTVAESLDGPFAEGIRQAARDTGTLVVVGTFTPAAEGRVHNTLLITGAGVNERYDKIHLFDAFGRRESDHVAPGDRLVTVDALGTTIGFATCYDLRFADQFTALGRAGARVICVPASWADGPGKAEQFDLLVRARAMDAQAWLVAADQPWTAPRGRAALGVGRSACVDPTGAVAARLGGEPGILITEIRPGLADEVRAAVPILA